ncbi:hypothetical protein V6Z12_D11G083400 [Gossypium hirsutum]
MRKTQSFKRRCVFSYLSGSKKMCIPCLFFCFSKYQGFTAQTIECEFVRKRKLKASRNDQSISMVEKANGGASFQKKFLKRTSISACLFSLSPELQVDGSEHFRY